MNLNGAEYFYLRNAQEDIIGLIDGDGVRVVSYADSWGKPIVTDAEKNDTNDTIKDGVTGSLANTVGVKNPYRYRGYRYDAETSLYYLQSRYYNPEWGRFLNADGILGSQDELLSFNMFLYCSNNPINGIDSNGQFWIGAIAAAIGTTFVLPAVIATVVTYAVVAAAVLITVAIIDVAVQEYRKNHITYADSSTPEDTQPSSPKQNKSKPNSKAKNKLKPDPNAQGDHTTFKRNPKTGEITNYETWKTNPKNPTGFDSVQRYDGIGEPHFNKVTKERLIPHVHDKAVPGGVRSPIPWEIPIRR